MNDKKGEYACFFCTKNIAENGEVDPCGLALYASVDRKMEKRPSQRFYCHITCLKEASGFKGNGIYREAFNEDV